MHTRQKRLALLIALAAIGGASDASAAKPMRGATYVGDLGGVGNLSFGVSADGKRIFGAQADGLSSENCAGQLQSFSAPNTQAGVISRGGTFREAFDGDSAFLTLTGSFGPRGRVSGSFSYVERGDCNSEGTFTARAQARPAGARRPLFTTGEAVVYGGGLDEQTDGSLLIAVPGGGPPRGDAVLRLDLDGRITTLLRRGGPETPVNPNDVVALPDGEYLLADARAHCVRRVSRPGEMTVVAGRCGTQGFAGDGGPATDALLNYPQHLSEAPDGGFYLTDGADDIFNANHRVRRVAADGTISTVAGNAMTGFAGDGGPAVLASFSRINDILAQDDGGLLIADFGSFRVRRVAPDGTVSTVAGSGFSGSAGDGAPATRARLTPFALAQAPGGGYLVSDQRGARVRRVDASGVISTFAGAGEVESGVPADRAALDFPGALTTLRNGGVALADPGLSIVAGKNERRLLLGVPARYASIKRYVLRRQPLPVRVTRRAVVTVTLRTRGGRTFMRARRKVAAGRSAIRLPRSLRPRRLVNGREPVYQLDLVAVAGNKRATASEEFFFNPPR